jgi:GT2 family glycosyltransferase
MNHADFSVSVVVPTYGRPDLLERCLKALLQQTLCRTRYEIIVCDDGPSRTTQSVVQAAAERSAGEPVIRYFAVKNSQGPAGARNVGWRASGAPVVAFTDDDTIPGPTWLDAGMTAMSPGVDAVAGRIMMPLPRRVSDYARDASHLQEAEFATANCFVRREALEEIGGFDEQFTSAWREDSDLHFSLIEHGYRIISAPAAMVIHPLRESRFAAGIAMQRKVMFDVLLYRKHPALYRNRIRKQPPWFYLLVSLSLLIALCAFVAGWRELAIIAALVWGSLSVLFFFHRLRSSCFTARNLGELLVTSAIIPPMSIFWRAVGAKRFGLRFP